MDEQRTVAGAKSAMRIQAFLIADVRGYTRFTHERGDEAAAALAAKFARIARETVSEGGGEVIELRGDEALGVFASARAAVVVALKLRDRLEAESVDDPELPLRSGIGLDAGEAVPLESGFRGGALNLAGRLCARARPGEILASKEITHLAGRVDGVRYLDGGRVRFKNFPDPVEVVRIVADRSVPGEPQRPISRSGERSASPQTDQGALPAMYGREEEIDRIEALLDAARQGISGALLIRGDLGTGKTSLLRFAAREASDMRCVETAGVESESEFAFAGLHAVLTPLRAHLDGIPDDHADALRGAMELRDPAGAGRLYLGAAMLSLLGAAAADQPLLCIVDDAHWLDPASADALRFTARRLEAEAVVLLFAAQDDAAHRFNSDGLESIAIGGLDEPAALQLVSDRLGGRVAPAVAAWLVKATGGNPRALLEAPLLLSEPQLAGSELIVGPLPVGDMHERAILRRLEPLSDAAGHALLVASAADTHTMRVVAQTDETITDGLEECEELGLVELGGGHLIFPDPLVRSAAYQAASASARRSAHADLARALEGDELARERRAWHLAASAVEPDEAIASELVAAAVSVQDRRGHAAAAELFDAAATLSPVRASRDHRRFLAARAWWHAGRPELTDRGLVEVEVTDDPLLLADARLLRGRMTLAARPDERAALALVAGADEVEPVDATRAALMLAAASEALPGEDGDQAADRAVKLSNGVGGKTEVVARLAAARRAAAVQGAADHLARIEEIFIADRSTTNDPEVILALAAGLPAPLPEYEEVLRRLTRGSIESARLHSVVALPHALLRAGRLDLTEGRWDDASIAFDESLRLFDETGQSSFAPVARAEMAFLEALRGRKQACLDHLNRLREDATDEAAVSASEGAVLGALELGSARSDEAVGHLERWAHDREGSLLPARWTPVDLVEATVRSSDRTAAVRHSKELGVSIEETLRAWIDALLASKPKSPAGYARAMEAADPSGDRPFFRARIRLNLGEQLRRQGLRVEAREHVREAIDTFDRLGASGWAERARQELRASGETARKRTPETLDSLTPQELQVARIVADGATYKEAAATLFLSPKTIEFHLAKVYRKLGISSRRELTNRLKETTDFT